MKLTEEVKQAIIAEYNEWKDIQYADLTKRERDELGAFYTPPEITIQMLEMCNSLEGTVLDPTCGSGNLLAAAIIAGADPNKVYGNEFEPRIVALCQKRLAKLGVPTWHIHQGDALDARCLEFSEDYKYPFKPTFTMVSLFD